MIKVCRREVVVNNEKFESRSSEINVGINRRRSSKSGQNLKFKDRERK